VSEAVSRGSCDRVALRISTLPALLIPFHLTPDPSPFRYLESSDPRAGGALKLVVNASHPEHGDYFQAALTARLSAMPHHPNERASLRVMWRHAFQPHRIAAWIYLQAVIVVAKSVPLFSPPDKAQYRARVQSACGQMPLLPCQSAFKWDDVQRWPWKA